MYALWSREIQIVPDYNPLDDMLTAQLKGGITQTMSLHLGEQEKQDVSYSGAANPVYERRESVGGETRCVGNSGSVGRRQQETVTRRGEKSAPEKNAGKCCLCYWRGVLFWQDSFSCFIKIHIPEK